MTKKFINAALRNLTAVQLEPGNSEPLKNLCADPLMH